MSSAPVGVYDSGLGGLTVLSALKARLPGEDFLYFADTRYLPYGDRPESFLRERGQIAAETLAARGCKALVIACNTATATAAESIRAALDHLPVIALEPGVKPAVALSQRRVIGVLATTRTLESPRFGRLLGMHAQGTKVIAQPCPGLAEAIETDGSESATVLNLLDRYVPPVAEADVVVLGCTHYPLVRKAIADRLGAGVHLIDTGEAVARQVQRVLVARGALGGGNGRLGFATSGDPTRVNETAARLWGERLDFEYWSL